MSVIENVPNFIIFNVIFNQRAKTTYENNLKDTKVRIYETWEKKNIWYSKDHSFLLWAIYSLEFRFEFPLLRNVLCGKLNDIFLVLREKLQLTMEKENLICFRAEGGTETKYYVCLQHLRVFHSLFFCKLKAKKKFNEIHCNLSNYFFSKNELE